MTLWWITCQNSQNVHQKVWPLDQDSFLVRGSVQRAVCACWGGEWVGYLVSSQLLQKLKFILKYHNSLISLHSCFQNWNTQLRVSMEGCSQQFTPSPHELWGSWDPFLTFSCQVNSIVKGLEVIHVQTATYVAPTKSQCKAKPPAEDITSITTTKCH